MMTTLRALLAAGGLFLVACGEAPTGVDDLLVDFRASAAEVHPGDSFDVTLTITNPTDRAIVLTGGSSCLATLDVYENGERVILQGAVFGCLAVITDFEVPPHGEVTRTYPLVAMLQENQRPWGYVVPPPSGDYRVVARMPGGMPEETARFRVVDGGM